MDTPQQKKAHKGGGIVRTEPYDMHLFDVEPLIREATKKLDVSISIRKCRGGTLR
jgi:hypothetical protein